MQIFVGQKYLSQGKPPKNRTNTSTEQEAFNTSTEIFITLCLVLLRSPVKGVTSFLKVFIVSVMKSLKANDVEGVNTRQGVVSIPPFPSAAQPE